MLQYIMLLFIMLLWPTTLFTTLQLCTPQHPPHPPNPCTTLPHPSQSTTHLSPTTRSPRSHTAMSTPCPTTTRRRTTTRVRPLMSTAQ